MAHIQLQTEHQLSVDMKFMKQAPQNKKKKSLYGKIDKAVNVFISRKKIQPEKRREPSSFLPPPLFLCLFQQQQQQHIWSDMADHQKTY